jgi:hypothetical protein
MFDHMLTSNSLKGEFHKYGLTEQDITFIKEQIDPKNNKKVMVKHPQRHLLMLEYNNSFVVYFANSRSITSLLLRGGSL